MKFCFSYLRWENLTVFKCYLLHRCLFLILNHCFLVVFVCSILCILSCAHNSVKTLISWSICLAMNLLPCLGRAVSQWKTYCLNWLLVRVFNLLTHIIVQLQRGSIVSHFHGVDDLIVILSSSRRFQYYSWEIPTSQYQNFSNTLFKWGKGKCSFHDKD